MSDKRLSEKQAKFVELYMQVDRPTIKEIAEILGVSERVIYLWKKDPKVIAAMKREASNSQIVAELPEIIDALVREAKNGSGKHIQMILQHLGMLTIDQRIKQKDESDVISDRERDEMNEQKIIDLKARMERLNSGKY